MHNAQAYVEQLAVLSSAPLTANGRSIVLSLPQAASLTRALRQDAEDYLFSAWITLADCLNGLQGRYYSWASVKAYYATFYAARAYLASSGHGIVYAGGKPRAISGIAGATLRKLGGTTHEAIFRLFASQHSSHILLSQTIDAIQPFEWLKARREDANYRNSKFCEPSTPRHFMQISQAGIRASLDAYVSDNSYLYTFDPDHAILAFPFAFVHEAQSLLASQGSLALPESDKRFLLSTLQDRKGPFAKLRDLCDNGYSIV